MWRRHDRVKTAAARPRPCAIVAALRPDENGDTRVLVLPINRMRVSIATCCYDMASPPPPFINFHFRPHSTYGEARGILEWAKTSDHPDRHFSITTSAMDIQPRACGSWHPRQRPGGDATVVQRR